MAKLTRRPRLVSMDDSLGGEATRGVPLGGWQPENIEGVGALERGGDRGRVQARLPRIRPGWQGPFGGDPSSNGGHHDFRRGNEPLAPPRMCRHFMVSRRPGPGDVSRN